ncbi:MAG: hypothetical protein IT374_26275 [Polyangiaceae bacterium]|nr:hypothetical protein [Polyangiaceae bacterium]
MITPKTQRIAVSDEGPRVHLAIGGMHALMPWEQARAIGRVLIAAAARAEETAKAEAVALDHALLLRADGIPFVDGAGRETRLRVGLTADPRILDEAAKEAAHNRELRRALPGGVRSSVQLPPPGVFATTLPAGPCDHAASIAARRSQT